MTDRHFQVLDDTTLYQPGVAGQVARIVGRGGREQPVPGTGLTLDEIQYYQQRGRRLQARAVATGLSRLFRATLRPFARLAAGLRRARREGAAIRQLNALDDRLLADIGLTRGQIPAAVAGLEARRGRDAGEGTARGTATTRVSPCAEARLESCNDAHDRQAA